jgi:DNA-cytosine methyltransferase
MTFGSLFAGIGGFDLGLERAGMECRWQVEIDDYAGRVLAKHWPHVTRWGDVRTFPPGQPDEWQVDLICAGVPCQPVSNAGKQKGAEDERWMWGEALRVVAHLKPAFFVAENPIGILSHDAGRTFRGLLRALASVGYVCEWHVIAAADVGAPHRRQRVWLVCVRDRHGTQTDAPCTDANGVGLHRAGIDFHGGSELRGEQERVVGPLGPHEADADSTGRKQRRRPIPATQEHCSAEYGCQDCGLSLWGSRAREALPTPNTVDAKGGTRKGKGQEQLCHLVGGSLNPTWVEWLMGYPTGWTDLGASETP